MLSLSFTNLLWRSCLHTALRHCDCMERNPLVFLDWLNNMASHRWSQDSGQSRRALAFSRSRCFRAFRCASRFSLLTSIFWKSFSSVLLLKKLFSSRALWRTSCMYSLFSASCFNIRASWDYSRLREADKGSGLLLIRGPQNMKRHRGCRSLIPKTILRENCAIDLAA